MKKFLACILVATVLLFSACSKQAGADAESSISAENFVSSVNESTSAEPQSDISAQQNQTEGNDKKTPAKSNNTVIETSAANNNNEDVQAGTEVPKANSVSLSVNCSNAVAYGIRENESFAKIIPENGVMFSSDNIVISDGENVMKLLKRVLKENKTTCQITSGGYVKSIGGLSEFDCGSNSGWMYKVNGILPNITTKSYKLNSGDKVEFIYTCTIGDV